MLGSSGSLCLNDSATSGLMAAGVALLYVCGPLDREAASASSSSSSNVYGGGLQFSLVVRGGAGAEVLLDHPLHLELLDENDNAPRFQNQSYELRWRPGTDGRMDHHQHQASGVSDSNSIMHSKK